MVEKWEAQKFLLIMQKAKFSGTFFFFFSPEQFDLKLLQKLEKL